MGNGIYGLKKSCQESVNFKSLKTAVIENNLMNYKYSMGFIKLGFCSNI